MKLILGLCVLSMTLAEPIYGQVSTQSGSTGRPSQSWQSISISNTNDLSVLDKQLLEIKKLSPKTQDQYVEMQRAIRSISKLKLTLIEDKTSAAYRVAESDYIASSVLLMANEGADAQAKTLSRMTEYFRGKKSLDTSDIQIIFVAAQSLEQTSDKTLAIQAYHEFASILLEKDKAAYSEIAAALESNTKRLELPGKVFELESKTLEDQSFRLQDISSKVTLVYFWSSKSEPCEREHPGLLSAYEKYHSQGFEIVGIGLDEDRIDAIRFTERLKTPWVVVWNNRKDGAAKIMQAYGVNAIPTMILLDRERKVISLEARGAALQSMIEQQLNPPQEAAPQDGLKE